MRLGPYHTLVTSFVGSVVRRFAKVEMLVSRQKGADVSKIYCWMRVPNFIFYKKLHTSKRQKDSKVVEISTLD